MEAGRGGGHRLIFPAGSGSALGVTVPQDSPFPAQARGGEGVGRGHSWAAWGLSHPRPPRPRAHAETRHGHTHSVSAEQNTRVWPGTDVNLQIHAALHLGDTRVGTRGDTR